MNEPKTDPPVDPRPQLHAVGQENKVIAPNPTDENGKIDIKQLFLYTTITAGVSAIVSWLITRALEAKFEQKEKARADANPALPAERNEVSWPGVEPEQPEPSWRAEVERLERKMRHNDDLRDRVEDLEAQSYRRNARRRKAANE